MSLVRLRYRGLVWIKNILRHIAGAFVLILNDFVFLSKVGIFAKIYLNFVVLPHGVLGYLIDLVRPPWG